jgi:hypothetical protein
MGASPRSRRSARSLRQSRWRWAPWRRRACGFVCHWRSPMPASVTHDWPWQFGGAGTNRCYGFELSQRARGWRRRASSLQLSSTRVRLSMWRDSKSAWRGVVADILEGGGGGRTRTYEGVSQRIYSPPPLPLGTLPRKKRAPDRGKPARAIWSAAESQSIENGPGSPRRPATRKEEPRQRTLGAKRRSHERNGAKFAVILGLITRGNAANIPYF